MFAHTDAAYLIADSILGELRFLRHVLAEAGCTTVHASGDEEEALAIIHRERIDLVILAWNDYHDGWEILQRLRRDPEHRQLPVLFIFDPSVDPACLARLEQTGYGVLGYGVKPLTSATVLHAIQELFDDLSRL